MKRVLKWPLGPAIGIGWWVERDTPPRDPEQEADQ